MLSVQTQSSSFWTGPAFKSRQRCDGGAMSLPALPSAQPRLPARQPSLLAPACTWPRSPPACLQARAPAAAASPPPLRCSQTCTELTLLKPCRRIGSLLLEVLRYGLHCRLCSLLAGIDEGSSITGDCIKWPGMCCGMAALCVIGGLTGRGFGPVIDSRVDQEAFCSSAVLAAALEGASHCCGHGLKSDRHYGAQHCAEVPCSSCMSTQHMCNPAPTGGSSHLAQVCILTHNESILPSQL